MKIRNYAKSVGFEVVGKLTYMGKRGLAHRWYMDESGNGYVIDICDGTIDIVPKTGGLIMANAQRLISADRFCNFVDENCTDRHAELWKELIRRQPTVDAVQVVHAKWRKSHIAGYLKCNKCEDAFIFEEWLESGKWNYCPNCGAKMDGEKDNV